VPVARIDEFKIPPLAVGLYDVVFAFDHEQRSAWLISQGWPESDSAARRDRAEARARFFLGALAATRNIVPPLPSESPCEILAPQHATGIEQLTSNFSRAEYLQTVRRAIDYIAAGDVYQVNLSQRLLHRASGSPHDLYLRLRERNPAPMAGFLDGGGWQLASASPERFLRVRDRRVETRPIKGTAALTRDAAVDRVAAEELVISPKDRAENVMIVDLLRNDLSRVCQDDSVRVARLCEIESFAHVHHLVSEVEGVLRDDCGLVDLLEVAFPGGSITGAPKVQAMRTIASLEPTQRGLYCGSLGYFSTEGNSDWSILIRSIIAVRGWMHASVGGGITAQSDPERELQETWAKARGIIDLLKSPRRMTPA
jgi:para-aminobenzoate synthetase component 1